MESLKKINVISLIFLAFILILGACGNSGGNEEAPDGSEKKDPTLDDASSPEGGSKQHGDGFGFTNFELDIEVDGETLVQADFDVDEKAEAEYENTRDGINVDGEDAMDELNDLFVNIRLTSDTSEKEAMDQILEHYNVEDYSKFELDVLFGNGERLDISESN